METTTIDSRSKKRMFEEIKDKCKSRARASIFAYLISMLIVIVTIIFLERTLDPHEIKDIITFIVSIILLCMSGLFALLGYRFYKKIDSLDTPEQLLQNYKKKNRNLKILLLVFWLVLIGERFAKSVTDVKKLYECVLLGIVALAAVYLMFVIYTNDNLSRKDKEIIEQLHDLIDNK